MHPVEHDVASGQRLGGAAGRVGDARLLDETGQGRGLRQVELCCAHSEEAAGRGLDAVGLASVVDEVEVALEDLVLGEVLLQRDGVLQLLDLARVVLGGRRLGGLRVVVAQGVLLQRDLDVLLGQGGGALGVSTAHVGDESATDALGVDAAVLVEAAVLDRDLGLPHDRSDLGERNDDAVLVVWGGDQRAVRGQDAGLLGQRVLGELPRQSVKDVDPLAGGSPGGSHSWHQQTGSEQAQYDRGRHEGPKEAHDVGEARAAFLHGSRVPSIWPRKPWTSVDRRQRSVVTSHFCRSELPQRVISAISHAPYRFRHEGTASSQSPEATLSGNPQTRIFQGR